MDEAPFDSPTVLAPTAAGVGDGRVVRFAFGLREELEVERLMRAAELATLADDFTLLRRHGYTVEVDLAPTRERLRAALYGRDTAALYWSSHGARDGALQLPSGEWVTPLEVDPAQVNPALRWVVFSSCHTGKHRRIWQARLAPGVVVVAWSRLVRQREAMAFNTPDRHAWGLDDLIRETLLPGGGGAEALPPPAEEWEDPRFEPGDVLLVPDDGADPRWAALFEAYRPHVLLGLEDRTGLTSRQAMWRLGALVGEGALFCLLPGGEERAAERRALAQWLAEQVGGFVPPFPAQDVGALAEHLEALAGEGPLLRAVARCGDDHAPLLACALRLFARCLRPPDAQPRLRAELERLARGADLPADAWSRALDAPPLLALDHAEHVLEALAPPLGALDHASRAGAYRLGERLAVATLRAARSASLAERSELRAACAGIAAELGVAVPVLPAAARGRAAEPRSVQVSADLIDQVAPPLAGALRRTHGRDRGALFHLALQLALLRLHHAEQPALAARLLEGATRAARVARVPHTRWQELGRLNERLPRAEGVALIDRVRRDLSRHLDAMARGASVPAEG